MPVYYIIVLVAAVAFVVVSFEIKIEIEVSISISISIECFSHNDAPITHHIDRQMDTNTPKTH